MTYASPRTGTEDAASVPPPLRDPHPHHGGALAELAGFLRARRTASTPGSAETPWLPSSRDVVAEATGITVDWYARIEQGRAPGLTEATLTAVCRALRLCKLDIAYARRLLVASRDVPEMPAVDPLPGSIAAMIAEMRATPAYAIDTCWRIRGHNEAAKVLLEGLDRQGGVENNCLWQHFMNRRFVGMLDDADAVMGYLAALFRYATADHAGARWRTKLIDRLSARSATFEQLWGRRAIADWCEAEKAFRHPSLGALRFTNVSHEVGTMTGERFRVVLYIPVPGTETARKVAGVTSDCGGGR